MNWNRLSPLLLSQKGRYLNLQLTEEEGRLHVLLPGFSSESSELFEIGLFGGTKSDPRLVGIKRFRFSEFARYLYFDYPPALPGPLLGLRLLGQGGGALFVQPQIAVSSISEKMGVLAAKKVDIPVLDHTDFKAPVDVNYERFRFNRTNEVFVRHSESEWRGELREDYKMFSTHVSINPLAELDDEDLSPAATLVTSSQQGYLTQVEVQNDSESSKNIALRVVTELPDADGNTELLKETRVIEAGKATTIVLAKKSAETGRIFVFAVADDEVPMALNTYYNYLLEVEPEAAG